MNNLKTLSSKELVELFTTLAPLVRKGFGDVMSSRELINAINTDDRCGIVFECDGDNVTFVFEYLYSSFKLVWGEYVLQVNQLTLLIKLRELGYLEF